MPWNLSAMFCRVEVENRVLEEVIWLHKKMFILYNHCCDFIAECRVTLFNLRFKNCNNWRRIVWIAALLSTLYTTRIINLEVKSVRIGWSVHNNTNGSRCSFFQFNQTNKHFQFLTVNNGKYLFLNQKKIWTWLISLKIKSLIFFSLFSISSWTPIDHKLSAH